MNEPTPFELAHRRLHLIGLTLEWSPGEGEFEYRVKPIGSPEAAWVNFGTLEAAVAHGDEIAAQRPLAQPAGVGRKRRGKLIYRSPKAYLKALRRRHNRRLWAGRGKI
jgi:hypothetical protein